ncbi:MAG: 23S rRNA (uracil(1939)-C(5))-methyltransferase RlmD [Huintestinicola sp.]
MRLDVFAIKKNDIITLEITDMTAEGCGVGHSEDGMTVFVAGSAVGDVMSCRIVKVQKSYCYGIIDKLLTPSPHREDRGCSVKKSCGGCMFRHISYSEELRIKENIVRNAFRRLGGFSSDEYEFLPPAGCSETDKYRNKAQYPVGMAEGKAVCGFYAPRSHRIIPCTDCMLQPDIFGEILKFILSYINEHKISVYSEETGKGLVRHIYLRRGYHSGEIMVCIVASRADKKSFSQLAEKLCEKFTDIRSVILNVNSKETNVIMGSECITLNGSDCITDIMCGNKIFISPLSFYQVNTAQAEYLYGIAREFASLTGTEDVLDLYCGAGTIGLSMAAKAGHITGAEIIPEAVENARRNAEVNSITNADFICADAGEAAKLLAESGRKPKVIITDPPRKGCDTLTLDSIISMSPDRVVMVSCNPATAARDCRYLADRGYRLDKVQAVDMFAGTGHVETVCLLSKLKSDQHIEVELKTDELDLTSAESKATYDEIKAYVKEHTGLTVSSLNIAQVKQKCGIIERENYNKAKSKDSRQPKCTMEKEEAIVEALRYFKMINTNNHLTFG